jgi:hypothetical protein
LAQSIFAACATRDLHLALVELPLAWFEPAAGSEGPGTEPGESDADTVTCLRSVLMKPEHEAWLGRIWERLLSATTDVLGG